MKKIFSLIMVLILLSACDNVDITRYPDNIQECYNGIIYGKDKNCTTNKKVIIKYCECTESQRKAYMSQINISDSASKEIFMNLVGYQELQKIYDRCAEQTGYVRVKNCKE